MLLRARLATTILRSVKLGTTVNIVRGDSVDALVKFSQASAMQKSSYRLGTRKSEWDLVRRVHAY